MRDCQGLNLWKKRLHLFLEIQFLKFLWKNNRCQKIKLWFRLLNNEKKQLIQQRMMKGRDLGKKMNLTQMTPQFRGKINQFFKNGSKNLDQKIKICPVFLLKKNHQGTKI